MVFLLLLALWFIPIVTYRIVRGVAPDQLWRTTGFALGLVVSPASLGRYSLYWGAGYLGMFGWPLAMVGIAGLMLALLHGQPGYYLAILLGLIERGTVVQGTQHLYLGIIDGVVWAIVYGTLGCLMDRWRTAGAPSEAA